MEAPKASLSAAQLRAARGLLDWTRSDLAKACGLSAETIKNIERGVYMPQETTIGAIVAAFREHHVDFTNDDGVRFRHDTVTNYEGVEGFKKFMDDVYQVALKLVEEGQTDKTFCMSSLDDSFFITYLGDFFTIHHVKRMNALKDKFKMFILVRETPKTISTEEYTTGSYREYRKQPNHTMDNVPFYVYGDKLAILIFEDKKEPQIIVISSPLVAKAYREQFNVLWSNASPINIGQGTKTLQKSEKSS